MKEPSKNEEKRESLDCYVTNPEESSEKEVKPEVPKNLIFSLFELCDLTVTTINIFNLINPTSSIYQMMRGLELFFFCFLEKYH